MACYCGGCNECLRDQGYYVGPEYDDHMHDKLVEDEEHVVEALSEMDEETWKKLAQAVMSNDAAKIQNVLDEQLQNYTEAIVWRDVQRRETDFDEPDHYGY